MADLASRAADEGLSVRSVEELVRKSRTTKMDRSKRVKAPLDPHLRHLEVQLQRHLGTHVRIQVAQGSTGRIEIPFYDAEDFERLTELLLGAEITGLR
jgi:ParB family chromosome partitioning protein